MLENWFRFQEMVDLNATNVVVDNKSKERAIQWMDTLAQTINGLGAGTYKPVRFSVSSDQQTAASSVDPAVL